MIHFGSFYGIITAINDFWTGNDEISGCYKLMTVQNEDGEIVNFIVTLDT